MTTFRLTPATVQGFIAGLDAPAPVNGARDIYTRILTACQKAGDEGIIFHGEVAVYGSRPPVIDVEGKWPDGLGDLPGVIRLSAVDVSDGNGGWRPPCPSDWAMAA